MRTPEPATVPLSGAHGSSPTWRAFLAALVRPSLTAVVVSIFTAASILFAVLCLSPQRTAALIGWYQSYSFKTSDDPAYCTRKALELQASSPAAASLVITGASTTRESFDEAELAARLSRRVGADVPIHNLTFSSQHVLETMALLDMIPAHFNGVVVIGISPIRMGKKVDVQPLFENVNLGVTSPSLSDEARHWNVEREAPTGLYAWDNRRFVLRLWNAVVAVLPRVALQQARHEPAKHFYRGLPRRDDAWQRKQYAQIEERLSAYAETLPKHLATMERLVHSLRARGLQVVLVEAPFNPQFAASMRQSGFYETHLRQMATFARRMGVDYLDLNHEAGLKPSDFYDWGHLFKPEAQRLYADALAQRLGVYFAAKDAP